MFGLEFRLMTDSQEFSFYVLERTHLTELWSSSQISQWIGSMWL